MLQGKLENQNSRVSENKFGKEKEKEKKLTQLDDKLSVLLAGQEAERRRLETTEATRYKEFEDKLDILGKSLSRLQSDFESEEQTRKTLNSTFAKNFAIKIEERFIKMEALVSSQKRQLAESEESRIRMLQNFDAKLQDLSSRVESERHVRSQRSEEDDDNWKRMALAVERLEKGMDEQRQANSSSEEGLVGRVNNELQTLRQMMDADRAQRESEDEEKMRMINEGIAFIKDGKETWLRMFDYKMMPIKLAREEEEAREAKRSKENEEKFAAVFVRLERLETNLEEERRIREDEIAVVQEDLENAQRVRENTEETMSRLLEHTVNRLDEITSQLNG